ncbi:MAG TPA: asparagine synthase (glutamine-hydrolyzing) [Candidatus Sumerlaeota bacterium]|nr:MAG: Asparagine synthetase (glutamine-hydrolyzing) 1 [candidate division BRC1 bacterium ADurb.Bin183]HOE64343.1 asparagine synthase (glutamine-hydrolyzing) [Candidatus Sumerlaeota bacterium]HON50825.1 asparagine synthase (glutamine-hydrolyzing) [Candidatus Sumerlaeota bacterium]HOR65519.1 asparagine synthase (glutamine-hydrolyzing) [Candidatus Sumerlaeota bacterium]HPL74528.1 asparagine synthase (glutamine-hydrolyzing) [Candidatus Sumerlaeota bacterium]
MSGICGYIGIKRFAAETDIIHRMCQSIIHRGPDEEGIWLGEGIAIGIRRLKIIDLVTGSQPIFNEDKSIAIVFNGEIYNFHSLKKILQEKGHRFYTRTDTETVVHSYEEWGEDFVQHFNGAFAFSIWDAKKEKLILVRDRIGEKPLYYTQLPDGGLIWGSEIKAIFEHPSAPIPEPDFTSIHHYLSLQYVPDPWSAFKNIRKLPPASILVFEKGATKIHRYWDLAFVPKHKESEQELSNELLERLQTAVNCRLMGDVPLGVFLSGGIDSSIITALVARRCNEKIKTFSIGFEEDTFSELPFARAVAQHYDTEHHEFIVRYEAADIMPRIIEHCDEPFADSSALPTFYLSHMTRKYVTVALNGDGGDETHAGYQRYYLDSFIRLFELMPKFIRKGLYNLFDLLPEPVNIPIEKNWIAGLKRLRQVSEINPKASILRWGSYFSHEMKWNNYTEEMKTRVGEDLSEDLLAEWFDRAKADAFVDKSLYVDDMNYLPGDLLVKADRMTMANSLGARSPFLDYELMEWVARLPVSMKLKGKRNKYLLKKTCQNLLPPVILKRGKQGFGIPLGKWFRENLKPMMKEILQSELFQNRKIFKPEYLNRIIQEHEQGRTDHGKRIWTLLMLEFWFRRYIDK